MIFTSDEPTRQDLGELDLHTVHIGAYLPWPCGECGRNRVELLTQPVRLHCDKCRAVIVLDLRGLEAGDFVEQRCERAFCDYECTNHEQEGGE